MQLFSLKLLLLLLFFSSKNHFLCGNLVYYMKQNKILCIVWKQQWKKLNNAEQKNLLLNLCVFFVTKNKNWQHNKNKWFCPLCLRFQFSLSSFCFSFIALQDWRGFNAIDIWMWTAKKIIFLPWSTFKCSCIETAQRQSNAKKRLWHHHWQERNHYFCSCIQVVLPWTKAHRLRSSPFFIAFYAENF